MNDDLGSILAVTRQQSMMYTTSMNQCNDRYFNQVEVDSVRSVLIMARYLHLIESVYLSVYFFAQNVGFLILQETSVFCCQLPFSFLIQKSYHSSPPPQHISIDYIIWYIWMTCGYGSYELINVRLPSQGFTSPLEFHHSVTAGAVA